MPELPEVEIVVRQLRQRLVGRQFMAPSHVHPQILERGARSLLSRLQGAQVRAVERRGKLILVQLDPTTAGPLVLTLHLRMTGRVRFATEKEPVAAHTHLRLPLSTEPTDAASAASGAEELRFSDQRRFGRLGLYRREDMGRIPLLRRLGPEPTEVLPADLRRRLARRPGPIKGALLDQSLIAGLGNIYVDEILFACGIHPLRPARSLTEREVVAVVTVMRRVLASAIRLGGSTIRDYRAVTDAPGRFQRRHRVFRRDGQACVRCGGTITKLKVAGRGTHLCPKCQPRRGGKGARRA